MGKQGHELAVAVVLVGIMLSLCSGPLKWGGASGNGVKERFGSPPIAPRVCMCTCVQRHWLAKLADFDSQQTFSGRLARMTGGYYYFTDHENEARVD